MVAAGDGGAVTWLGLFTGLGGLGVAFVAHCLSLLDRRRAVDALNRARHRLQRIRYREREAAQVLAEARRVREEAATMLTRAAEVGHQATLLAWHNAQWEHAMRHGGRAGRTAC